MKQKITTRMIATMGLLVALQVVLSQVLGIETQYLRLSFSFVPTIIMGMLFGPLWAGIGCVLADFLGMALFPKAAFFFGFTINAFIGGLIYGYFFYKKEISWKNAIGCALATTIVISLILTPIWLSMMYNQPLFSWVIWAPRLIKTVIMLPIQAILNYMVGRMVPLQKLIKRVSV
ncbi:MAG: folate family ECF transporter S component [Enterococcus italicus]|nr:folate family ECF transporter S component [Enterococcus italicus]MCM6881781.1 folate family ECF transporter S component [Enterococcus italicus]OJG60650.1 folate ECF transporter [Enterococcus italicus DSM 15952]